MNVLVTGATGLVGGATVLQLLGAGREVRALVRADAEQPPAVPSGVELIRGDVTDPDAVGRAMRGVDVVYHVAGLPERWLRDRREFEYVNAGGTRVMVETALRLGVRAFISTSTIDVFEHAPGVAFDESKLLADPRGSAYRRSMVQADRIVVAAMGRGLRARIAHPAAVYGPSRRVRRGVNRLLADLLAARVPALVSGGLPLVHVDDVATAMRALEDAPVGTRVILSEGYYPLRAIAASVHELDPTVPVPETIPDWRASLITHAGQVWSRLSRRPPSIADSELDLVRAYVVPSAARARRTIGWQPRSLVEGLVDTIPALRLANDAARTARLFGN